MHFLTKGDAFLLNQEETFMFHPISYKSEIKVRVYFFIIALIKVNVLV